MNGDFMEFMKDSAEHQQKLFEMVQQCIVDATLQRLLMKEVLAWAYRQEPDPQQSILTLKEGILRQIESVPGPLLDQLKVAALQFFEVLAAGFPKSNEDDFDFASVSHLPQ